MFTLQPYKEVKRRRATQTMQVNFDQPDFNAMFEWKDNT
jgi:hypothetical protein